MSAQPDGGDEQYEADCGHMVTKETRVTVPEITLCEECYAPASVEKWPEVLSSKKSRAGRNRYGSVEYHQTKTYLLGLDRRGRGVYLDEGEGTLKYVVPKNDHAYQDDRENARERWDRDLRPLREYHVGPEPDPGYPGKFHTLPNNDHLVVVERLDLEFRPPNRPELKEKLADVTEDWQAFRTELVPAFDLEGRFGTESGQPLVNLGCDECEHTETQVDPVEHTECPECGSFRFSEYTYREITGETDE